jgi:hypothetical protein
MVEVLRGRLRKWFWLQAAALSNPRRLADGREKLRYCFRENHSVLLFSTGLICRFRPLSIVMFHIASHASDLLVQLLARVLESIADGKRQMGMAFVLRRGALDVHLLAFREIA